MCLPKHEKPKREELRPRECPTDHVIVCTPDKENPKYKCESPPDIVPSGHVLLAFTIGGYGAGTKQRPYAWKMKDTILLPRPFLLNKGEKGAPFPIRLSPNMPGHVKLLHELNLARAVYTQ